MTKFYITTAIDYPNNKPHIGHAFEKIGADVQARYRRMQGFQTWFLVGNDENTVKVSKRAAELGKPTKAYVDEMAGHFKEAWARLAISNDDFIQTSEERHAAGCRRFIQRVYEAGYIYKKAYEALYCEGCESFKTPKDLADGRCPNHPDQPLKTLQEENWFFALSRFRDRLLALYRERPDFILPATRRNEIVSLVEGGLDDISITRQHVDWGIRAPFDPTQTIYVWFDALLNYVTAIGYGTDDARFVREWPADMHVIGKDITRFHCALWPAMLLAAGVELPRRVQVHGFLQVGGEKVSKSRMSDASHDLLYANALYNWLAGRIGIPSPSERDSNPTVTDAFRYFFMRECPFTGDGAYSQERIVSVYNSDLANNLGNLYSRTVTMALRYFNGDLGSSHAVAQDDTFAGNDMTATVRDIQGQIEACEYNIALALVWQHVLVPANQYIDRTKPFELAKKDPEACRRTLINLAEAIRVAAILLKPFLPATAETLYGGFGFPAPWPDVRMEHAATPPTAGGGLRVTAALQDGKVRPLFPRIEAGAPAAEGGAAHG